MKKILTLLLPIFALLGFQQHSRAQCDVIANGYPLEICKGEPVTLTAAGACGYLMLNDFENGTVGLGWSSNASPMFNNPCQPITPPASGIVCWIGSATNFPRQLTTIAYNLSIGSGCLIEFAMKYGANEPNPAPNSCESPDLPNEGVHLQYSSNSGATWTDINYWVPVPGNAATGPYYVWNQYSEIVPIPAYSPNTQFRWYQDLTSGNTWDHWGIDNVEITCGGMETNVLWNTGDTTYSIVVYPDSSQSYIVTVYDSLYNSKDTVDVIVHQIPSSDFTLNTPICSESDSVIFEYTGNADASAEFFWTLSGGLRIQGHGPGPYILDSLPAGEYMAMLNVNNHGCNSGIDTMYFSVYQKPLVSFSADLIKGCDPITVNFTNNTFPIDIDYVWEWSDGTSDTARHQTHYFPYNPNDSAYSVTLKATTDLGCYGEYTIEDFIAVYPNPEADYTADPDSFHYQTDILPIQFTDISTFDPISWLWDFGDGNTSNEQNPEYTYTEPGYYTVLLTVETEFGCIDTISYLVKIIRELGDSLIFPNVFTPNGDGINDYFEIKNLEPEHYLGRQLVVFNRYGKKVYESNNYLNQWDGAGLAEGTYFFIFRYQFAFTTVSEEKEVSGSVTILR